MAQNMNIVYKKERSAQSEHTFLLRDTLLLCISKRTPRQFGEILILAQDQYGSCTERQVRDALKWLKSRNKITQVKLEYWRLPETDWRETPEDAEARKKIQLAADGMCRDCAVELAEYLRDPDMRRCDGCFMMRNAAKQKTYNERHPKKQVLLPEMREAILETLGRIGRAFPREIFDAGSPEISKRKSFHLNIGLFVLLKEGVVGREREGKSNHYKYFLK